MPRTTRKPTKEELDAVEREHEAALRATGLSREEVRRLHEQAAAAPGLEEAFAQADRIEKKWLQGRKLGRVRGSRNTDRKRAV